MRDWNTEQLIEGDKRFGWLPFTDMHRWCAPEHEPLVSVEGWGTECLRGTEGAIPDMLVLDKGLTGRYLPLAITFISEELFSAFDGLVSGAGR